MEAKHTMAGGSGSLKADLDVLRGVSQKLAQDYQSLQDAIVKLQGEAEMHSATWSGAAKTAWNNAMVNVNNAWSALNATLDEVAGNISTSGANYDTQDSDSANSYNKIPTTGITSSLGGS
jgi:WXG100 family type VII secretion target